MVHDYTKLYHKQKKNFKKTVKLLKVDMKTKCRLNRVINLLLIVYIYVMDN